jgi:hypothetical protein
LRAWFHPHPQLMPGMFFKRGCTYLSQVLSEVISEFPIYILMLEHLFKILNWELSVNLDVISSIDNIGWFAKYVGGNWRHRRKPMLSERVALSITWGMGFTRNRTHDLRGDRRWC